MFWIFAIDFKKVFDFLPGPGSLTQKLQAGFDTGIVGKAFYRNAPAKLKPAMVLHQLIQHHFKSDAVQRIIGLRVGFRHNFVFSRKGRRGILVRIVRRQIRCEIYS